MDELSALEMIGSLLGEAGDDAAVVDGLVLTTDMLHETTDFPKGITRYTAGWRAVGASLSDVAAMGAEAVAAVAVYGAPSLEEAELRAFVRGASDVCDRAGARYVGGDLDIHEEFTVAAAALGRVSRPVYRSGARAGDAVYVTGTLGRTGAALRLDDPTERERLNALFRFDPRVDAGLAIAPAASAMIDSSDGLARSLHQLAKASGCGFSVDRDRIPIHPAVEELADDRNEREDMAFFCGEDYELVFTAPRDALAAVRDGIPVSVTEIGEATDTGAVRVDGEALPNRGYAHSRPSSGVDLEGDGVKAEDTENESEQT